MSNRSVTHVRACIFDKYLQASAFRSDVNSLNIADRTSVNDPFDDDDDDDDADDDNDDLVLDHRSHFHRYQPAS